MKPYRILFISISIGVLTSLFILSAATFQEPNRKVSENTNVGALAQEMRTILEQMKMEGLDVSEAEELDLLSKQAAEKGQMGECARLIFQARSVLEDLRDLPKEVMVELPVSARQVELTLAVPNFPSGKDIKEFRNAFRHYTVGVINGRIVLRLTSIPLFVEEIPDSGPGGFASPRSEDSPFGLHEPMIPPFNSYDTRMDDLNAQWIRLSGPSGVVWDADEPRKGEYDWSRLDKIISLFSKQRKNLVMTILNFNRWDRGIGLGTAEEKPVTSKYIKIPQNLTEYESFLKEVVKRYPVVKHWQIENELDDIRPGDDFDAPKKFAEMIRISSRAIKAGNPEAKIILPGVAAPFGYYKIYEPMLDTLSKMRKGGDERIFDIVDFHWSLDTGGDYRSIKGHKMRSLVEDIRRKLDSLGCQDISLWITEMSSYSRVPGIPPPGAVYVKKSESDHAADVIKSYVYPLSLGVKKVFWTFGLVEYHNFGGLGANNYFDTVSLIHNPLNGGKSHKKLAYYSYKFMADRLNGSNEIKTLDLGRGVYAFKCLKANKSVYVLWYDRN